jgi:DNA polymerase (family 10)
MALSAADIAKELRELGQRLELKGGNPYRARAYVRAADNLALIQTPLGELVAEDRLQEIPGVGDALASVIANLYRTGRDEKLDAMRKTLPAPALELLQIPGLRGDRIQKLRDVLGVRTLKDLEKAALSGRLAKTKGFGPAFQAKVLGGLAVARGPQGLHLHRAAAALSRAAKQMKPAHPNLTRFTPAGDFRRGGELVKSLCLVAVDPSGKMAGRALTAADGCRVVIADEAHFGAALLFATGSDAHLKRLKALAGKRRGSLTPNGFRRGGRIIATSEEEIYEALGLAFIPPELRETGKEVDWALAGDLPDLVTDKDILGVLHAHTDQSDGTETLDAMVAGARKRGYSYLGLTDHSQTASYAGGLTPA